jgi:hypothetical protein
MNATRYHHHPPLGRALLAGLLAAASLLALLNPHALLAGDHSPSAVGSGHHALRTECHPGAGVHIERTPPTHRECLACLFQLTMRGVDAPSARPLATPAVRAAAVAGPDRAPLQRPRSSRSSRGPPLSS